MYAVIDLETTGGRFSEEGITEIAIYRYDGTQVVDQLISLVNPLRPIDPYVTRLTGIDNKMLRRAPRFYEIARRVIQITEGCAIVAHNADFDYRMLRQEFARLGYVYERNTICTVHESQRLIPDLPSYSLGKLCKSLGIPVASRHRAYGDAQATLELLKLLIEKDSSHQIVKQATAPIPHLSREEMRQRLILDTLPTFGGIFHILDKDKNILFIGRSGNIYKEINTILCSEDEISLIIREEMASVRWEETPSDAISYLKFLLQIKIHRPILNPEEKSRRMSKSLRHYFHREKILLVVDRGRNVSEKSVILVEKGELKGYTYCELNYQINNIDVLKTRLTPLESTPDNLYAIRAYIRRNPRVEVIEV